MAFHPIADELTGARGDSFFEEGHASALADLVADVSTERRAKRRGEDEQRPVGCAECGHQDEHDVGEAGDRQRNEGGVDDGDEKEPDDAKADGEMKQGRVTRAWGYDLENDASRGRSHESGGVRGHAK